LKTQIMIRKKNRNLSEMRLKHIIAFLSEL